MVLSDIPISKTKIILPKRRAELLSRARLLDILYERLDRKLIIVSAPAGYGKTSLLIDLAYHSDLTFCWLALDPLDRDPQRFIAYFIAALSERFPQFGNRSRSILNGLTSLEEGMERLLVTLVNEIYDEIHEHFVLVLDDFHLLDEIEPIHYFVNRFIQLVGENCHLVLSSRSLPSLSDIPLLVAREQIGGLDFSDLSFQPEEIQALLAQNQQIHLSDEEARKLVEATEGWVTGLQFTDLNLLKAGESSFSATHAVGVSIFDYLGQQVLQNQPEFLKLFLLRSSLLEEFDTALCEAVLGPLYPEPQDWSKLLETISQKNLFALPVGANGQWLRYHHLFRDYLQQRFRREYPKEATPILQRLAQFHEAHGEWERAYQLYEQLGDVNALADMIERAGITMLQRAMLTLDSWLKNLPPSVIQKRARLLSLRGAIESARGSAAEGIILFTRAITKFHETQDVPSLALALVRRGMTYRFLGDYKNAIRDAEEATQLTESRDDLQWNYADALRVKGLSLFRQGQTIDASNYLEHSLEIYSRVNDSHLIPILLMETGVVHAATGNYNQAKASYEKALEIWRQTGNLSWQASLLNNLASLYQQHGEYEQAAHAFEEGLLCAKQSGDKRMEALICLSMGDLYGELEDFEIAEQNYKQANELIQQLGERFLFNYLHLAEANLAIAKKDTSKASRLLDQVSTSIEASASYYESGLYQLLRGRLLLQDGRPMQAASELVEAKQYFTQGGREMESIWSYIWLAAVYFQNKQEKSAREEIKTLLQIPNHSNHFTIVTIRQARDWLEPLRNDSDVKVHMRRLFEKADRLNDQLPRIRRQLRRTAHTMEIPSPSLIIRAFGPGQVWLNGRLITMSEWQTQSVRELFFYFLAASRPLTREQVGETLWPKISEPGKFKMRFKNEIYRLRCAVGQETILFEHDYYQFNARADHEYDIEAFESFLAKADSATTVAEQINFYQKAIDLVQGQYLEDFGADWVLPKRERLRQAFLSAALVLANLYSKEGHLPKAVETCQRALAQDCTFEAAYRLLMQIYHRMGDKPSVIHIYNACKKNMQKVFDLPPSQETQQLYHELIS